MRMRARLSLLMLFTVLTLSFSVEPDAEMTSTNYRIPTTVMSGGSGPMGSTNFQTNSTVGQQSPLLVGDQNPFSDFFDMYPGFWYKVEMEEEGVPLADI